MLYVGSKQYKSSLIQEEVDPKLIAKAIIKVLGLILSEEDLNLS